MNGPKTPRQLVFDGGVCDGRALVMMSPARGGGDCRTETYVCSFRTSTTFILFYFFKAKPSRLFSLPLPFRFSSLATHRLSDVTHHTYISSQAPLHIERMKRINVIGRAVRLCLPGSSPKHGGMLRSVKSTSSDTPATPPPPRRDPPPAPVNPPPRPPPPPPPTPTRPPTPPPIPFTPPKYPIYGVETRMKI